MKRISEDKVQQALAEHAEALKPKYTDTSTQNDWTKSPTLTTLPQFDITAARRSAQERLKR